MLDESSQAQAFPVGPDSHGYPGSGPSSTPRRDSATQGSGGGLFDYDRSSPATSRGTTSASRTRFNLPSPAGSMGTPDAETADRWVTVFGFGQSMQSLILREFRNHGEIVRHVSGKGNWMHILVSFTSQDLPCCGVQSHRPTISSLDSGFSVLAFACNLCVPVSNSAPSPSGAVAEGKTRRW